MSEPNRSSGSLMTRDDLLAMEPVPASERIRYGDLEDQWIDIYRPVAGREPAPTAILLHGGCWRDTVPATYFGAMARALSEHGITACNVEYRRLASGGGWPTTCVDVATAVDLLLDRADSLGVDAERVALVGHSAGGHLALWSAARHHLPSDAPGARRTPLPLTGVLALAAMPDLTAAHARGICQDAVSAFLGNAPEDVPEALALASPAELPPTEAPHLHLVGELDHVVPFGYVRAAATRMRAAGQDTRVVLLPGSGHMEPAVPGTGPWAEVLGALETWLGVG